MEQNEGPPVTPPDLPAKKKRNVPKHYIRRKIGPNVRRKIGPNKPGAGRPKFDPTEKQRAYVEAFIRFGYSKNDIAAFLGIDTKTLDKHFPKELEFAEMHLIAVAMNSLSVLLQGRPAQYDQRGNIVREEIPISKAAVFFTLRVRGKKYGWTERLELVGDENNPLSIKIEGGLPEVPCLPSPRTVLSVVK